MAHDYIVSVLDPSSALPQVHIEPPTPQHSTLTLSGYKRATPTPTKDAHPTAVQGMYSVSLLKYHNIYSLSDC